MPLLELGETFLWELVHPNRVVPRMVAESPLLADVFKRAIAEYQPSMEHPWRLVVAWDEFSPGNKLKVDNTRKCMNLSFSFVELGQTALTQNWAWFTCVCLRSHMIARTRGGWSAYLRAFLRIQMLSAGGLATGGVPLCIGGNTIMLYARVANLLSDGDGLRSALDWKGHASMKPCFRHCNIFKKDSDLAHRRPGFEEITCSDPSKFKTWTAKEVWHAVDVLQGAHVRWASGDMTKGQVENIEKMYGLNYNRDGVLADVELRAVLDPVHAFTYDWVHTFLSDGLFSCEAFLMIKACEPLGIHQSHLCAYLKDSKWQFPLAHTSKSKSLYRVFDVYRSSASTEADRLKSSASELLGLYGLLRHFVEVHVGRRDDIAAQREVFDQACTMLDLIMSAKRGEQDICLWASALWASAVFKMASAIKGVIRGYKAVIRCCVTLAAIIR